MYTELSHVELKSAEGDPYFKFPEWTPGSLQFREHQCEEKAGGHNHLLTQFPSTVRLASRPPPPASSLSPLSRHASRRPLPVMT